MSEYKPIDCGQHGEYELAIMHRKQLDLCWHATDGECCECVLPLDIVVRNHEEFLLVKNEAGDELEIRLDWIKADGFP